ncbi:hypothetical protein SprV_0200719300 [Sparganum proliferum]
MQYAWKACESEEIQGYAVRKGRRNFFAAVKSVYGPTTKGTAPLHICDGTTLLTEKAQILKHWAVHFRGDLDRPSTISDAAITCLVQVETYADLDLQLSLHETIEAEQQVSRGKAPRSDAIPSDIYKHGDS